MILIGAILGLLAMFLVSLMIFLAIFWSMRKSLKSLLFQRRLQRFVPWSSLILCALIIINAMVMRLSGVNTSLFMLIPAVGSMFFGFYACGVLRRNFIHKIKEGMSCNFVVSCFTTSIAYGYAVVENIWIDAMAEIPEERLASLKERQQVTAVICKSCPDDKIITVRF